MWQTEGLLRGDGESYSLATLVSPWPSQFLPRCPAHARMEKTTLRDHHDDGSGSGGCGGGVCVCVYACVW